MVENFKEVAEYIQNTLAGCKFVGISSDNEVFVEFDYEDVKPQTETALHIRKMFSYVTKVTVVVRPSIKEVTQMVDDLNTYLDDQPKNPNLLDIENL